MLIRIGLRALTVAATAVTSVALGGSFAAADGANPVGGGGVICTQPDAGSCTVDANKTGSPSSTPSPSQSSGSGGRSGSSGSGASSPPSPEQTLINGDCTYAPAPDYTPMPGEDQHTGEKGAWYVRTCPDGIKLGGDPNKPVATTTQDWVWLTTPPPAALLLPTPAVLAQRAQQLLKLTTPVIASNPRPGLPQLVGVNMWAWLPTGVFTPVSATAEVPGESVTATARPTSVSWNFGDGTSITCPGAGTPFPAGGDPEAVSPTCGHTYAHSSGSGTFTVSATINWNVTWAGAGQAGAFNGMTTTVSEQVVVQQSQALVTNG
ncbi:MAG: hypothetical protein ACJ786_23380 [Catenulispora sp.]